MFRDKILPTVVAVIAAFLVIGIFPRYWLDALGLSDLVKGIVIVVAGMGVALIVERLLRRKP